MIVCLPVYHKGFKRAESKADEDDGAEASSIQIFIQEEPECQNLSQNPGPPSGTKHRLLSSMMVSPSTLMPFEKKSF
jgi:hypothetical protein